jgi:hypothetical protein
MEYLKELLGFVVLSGPLLFLFIFLVVSVVVVILVSRAGRRRGKRWGRWAAVALLLFAFWDLPPTLGIFWYQCANHAGFTQYQTLEDWKRENPGVAKTLTPYTDIRSTRVGFADRYQLNQRFAWEVERTQLPLRLERREERIVDTLTGKVLAQYVDFGTRRKKINWWNPRDYKFWLNYRSCESGDGRRTKPNEFEFNKFMYLLQHQREYKK